MNMIIFDSTEEPPLRHVEKDVLIPKMMREKAKERCVQHVDGTMGLYSADSVIIYSPACRSKPVRS